MQFGLETIAGMALRLHEIEEQQQSMDGAEERIKNYLASFHQTRKLVEDGTQISLDTALRQTGQILEMVIQLNGTIPSLHARMNGVEKWQDGFTSRLPIQTPNEPLEGDVHGTNH